MKQILFLIGIAFITPVSHAAFFQCVEKEGLKVVGGADELKTFCIQAIEENPDVVTQIKEGNEKAINFLVGQVMKKTKGRADPGVVQEAMKELLK